MSFLVDTLFKHRDKFTRELETDPLTDNFAEKIVKIFAASYGGTFSFLLNEDIDVNITDKWGRSPIHYAARAGHSAIVKGLINAGADLNKRDQWGSTPLHISCHNGHKNVVDVLIQHGADVDIDLLDLLDLEKDLAEKNSQKESKFSEEYLLHHIDIENKFSNISKICQDIQASLDELKGIQVHLQSNTNPYSEFQIYIDKSNTFCSSLLSQMDELQQDINQHEDILIRTITDKNEQSNRGQTKIKYLTTSNNDMMQSITQLHECFQVLKNTTSLLEKEIDEKKLELELKTKDLEHSHVKHQHDIEEILIQKTQLEIEFKEFKERTHHSGSGQPIGSTEEFVHIQQQLVISQMENDTLKHTLHKMIDPLVHQEWVDKYSVLESQWHRSLDDSTKLQLQIENLQKTILQYTSQQIDPEQVIRTNETICALKLQLEEKEDCLVQSNRQLEETFQLLIQTRESMQGKVSRELLIEAENRCVALQQKLDMLTSEKNEIVKRRSIDLNDNDITREANGFLIQELENCKNDLEMKEKKIEELTEIVKDHIKLRRDHQQSQEQLKILQDSLKYLVPMEQCLKAEERCKQLDLSLSTCETDLSNMERMNRVLEAQLDDLKMKLAEERAKLLQPMQSGPVRKLEERCLELQRQVSELGTVQDELTLAKVQLKIREDTISDLTSQLELSRQQAHQAHSKASNVTDLNEELTDTIYQLSNCQKELAACREELIATKESIKSLVSREILIETQRQMRALEATYSVTSQELSDVKASCLSLESTLSDCQMRLAKKTLELRQATEAQAQHYSEIQSHLDEMCDLRYSLLTITTAHKECQEKLQIATKELEQAKKLISSYRSGLIPVSSSLSEAQDPRSFHSKGVSYRHLGVTYSKNIDSMLTSDGKGVADSTSGMVPMEELQETERKNAEQQRRLSNLERNLSNCFGDLTAMKRKNVSLEHELADIRDKLHEKTVQLQQVNQTQNALLSSRTLLKERETRLAEITQQLQLAQERLSVMSQVEFELIETKNDLKKYKDQLEQLQETFSTMVSRTLLHEKESKCAELELQMISLKDTLSAKSTEIAKLSIKNSHLLAENKSLKIQLEEKTNEVDSVIRIHMREYEDALIIARAQLKQREEKIEEYKLLLLKDTSHSSSDEISIEDTKIKDEKKKALNSTNEQNLDFQQEIDRLNNVIVASKAILSNREERLSDAISQLEDSEGKLMICTRDLEALKDTLKISVPVTQFQELQQRNTELQGQLEEIPKLQKSLQGTQTRLEKCLVQLKQAEHQNEAMEVDLKDLRAKNKELSVCQQRIIELEIVISKLQRRLQEYELLTSNTETEYSVIASDFEGLKAKLIEKDVVIHQLESDGAILRNEIVSKLGQVAELEQKNENLANRFFDLARQLNESHHGLNTSTPFEDFTSKMTDSNHRASAEAIDNGEMLLDTEILLPAEHTSNVRIHRVHSEEESVGNEGGNESGMPKNDNVLKRPTSTMYM